MLGCLGGSDGSVAKAVTSDCLDGALASKSFAGVFSGLSRR